MTILCIDDSGLKWPCIVVGETYETEGLCDYKGIPSYFLPSIGYHFVAERFIPTSDIDETEIKKTEPCYI